ncbi:MAG: Gx transporter family protein [Lachnospiraceae bacterium]|nr:Gx transporter family protein [Lachnospiraceae bacterium]
MKRRVAFLGMVLALALILAYVETFLPLPIAVPGIKLGLANCVILFVLYLTGIKEAALISITRVFLTGFLFGNMAGILYSLSGAFLSLIAMAFAKKQNGLSVIGVSILGGVTHNIGQMIMAVLVTETIAVLYYVPVLLIAGMTTGIINGILAKTILKNKNIIIEGWK